MRILLTGGTGFIGRTFLDGLRSADLASILELTLVSREPDLFRSRYPEFFNDVPFKIELIRAELPDLQLDSHFDVLVHGAEMPQPDVSPEAAKKSGMTLQLLLRSASASNASRFVYLSSGAVYTLDPELRSPFEVGSNLPDPGRDKVTYASLKYRNEQLVREYCGKHGLSHVILRIFNVASRHVPLEGRYALGNFVRDALSPDRSTIDIRGSGRDRRSFISGRHLAGLMRHSLDHAPDGIVYNACSEDQITIGELAGLVSEATERRKPVTIGDPRAPAAHYAGVPNIPREFLSSRGDIRKEIDDLVSAWSPETGNV